MVRNLWTDQETLIARRLLAKGACNNEFRAEIGRTKAAAISRIKWLDDPQEPYRSAERARKSRGNITGEPIRRRTGQPHPAPESVREDAARRADAPRTITAWFFGDPAPGQSALDKREQRA